MNDRAELPILVSESWDWQVRAACQGMDASMFFHPENERGCSRRRREEQAKRICSDCPARQECLGWALCQCRLKTGPVVPIENGATFGC